MTKKYRLYIAVSLLISVIGFIGMLVKEEVVSYLRVNYLTVLIFFITLLLFGFVMLIYVFLQGGFTKTVLKEDAGDIDEERIKNFLGDFTDNFVKKLEENEKVNLNEAQIQELVESKLSKVTDKTVLEQIEKKYGESIIEKIKVEEIKHETYELKNRLEKEASKLSRNSSINLSIGVLTTSFAIFILGYSLLSYHPEGLATRDYLMSISPRLSLSLFIEIFSFFFLRLYRNNLEDIKYLNNEKTNVDLKLIALKTAVFYKDNQLIKDICIDYQKRKEISN